MGETKTDDLEEKTPPGFEHVVKALKDNPEVDNPWAIAWSMHGKGYTPHSESGAPRDPAALYRRHQFECSREQKEAASSTTLGAVLRKDLHESDPAMVARAFRNFIALRETTPERTQDVGGDLTPEVVIISAGRGNKRDRNFYPPESLARSVEAFEGAKCFLDHPSRREEEERPERSVREIAGWFSEVRFDPHMEALVGRLHTTSNAAGREAQSLVRDAVRYQRQYPSADKVLCGLSINAEGPSHLEEMDGMQWNVVEGIHRAMSADLVTFPARGGKILGMREAEARWAGVATPEPPINRVYLRAVGLLRERLKDDVDHATLVADIRYALPLLREAFGDPRRPPPRPVPPRAVPAQPAPAARPDPRLAPTERPDPRAVPPGREPVAPARDEVPPARDARAAKPDAPGEKKDLPPWLQKKGDGEERPEAPGEQPPPRDAVLPGAKGDMPGADGQPPSPGETPIDDDDLHVQTRDERRLQILEDLSEKAEAAEATHDPQVIATLLTALNAFLDDEMSEPTDPGYEVRQAAGEADDFSKYANPTGQGVPGAGGPEGGMVPGEQDRPPGWPPEQPPPTSASTEARSGQPGEGTLNTGDEQAVPGAGEPPGAEEAPGPTGAPAAQTPVTAPLRDEKGAPVATKRDEREEAAMGQPIGEQPAARAEPDGDEFGGEPEGPGEPDGDEPGEDEPDEDEAPAAAAGVPAAAAGVSDAGRAAAARGDREKAARADRFRRYQLEGGGSMKCEACGYEQHREAAAPPNSTDAGGTKMTEGQAAPAEGASPLHEAEREELQRLREQENYRERWRKANAAVEEAGVAIDPKRLLPFEESQWPLLIEAAATTSRPFVGATEPPPIVRPSIKPLSARQFFESQYGATE